jgi:glycosidase
MISSSDLFYHIYPLGMCGAPLNNDFSSPAGDGLRKLIDRIPHFVSLGVTAVYIGPLFESISHGYDTVDYWHVDRRLGTDEDLANLVRSFHDQGIKVILDAVLNHTGRDFFAFRDLKEKGQASPYRHWYRNVDFGKRSPEGDQFSYEGWAGHFSLAKLDTSKPDVRTHLFDAIRHWIGDFGIDGLRLDAADVLEPDFMDALSTFCKGIKPDFWLMGEVVHGDYRNWARAGRLDSVTNYELYKGLWSSFNDRNFFEIAWSLNRQSGHDGIYRSLELYNFAENHDVNRVASMLKSGAHLFPLYGLLFTVPGIPSLYYGGEWGTRGEKKHGSDAELRPAIRETAEHGTLSGMPESCKPRIDSCALESLIRNLARFRREHPALAKGSYRQVFVSNEQFAFERKYGEETLVIAVNSGANPAHPALADLPRERTLKELFTIGDQSAPGGAAYRSGPRGFEVAVPANGFVIYELA